MANKSQKFIKNAAAAIPCFSAPCGNSPAEYGSMQKQYLSERSKAFAAERAYLASDYVEADVQGLTDNFYEYTHTFLRLSDVTSITAAATKNADDYKIVLLSELGVDYLPIGAKIRTMGSTWICINPGNMSSALADALIARCNTSYNSYDYYGNIITEPIYVSHSYMMGNSNDPAHNLVMMDGSFDVTCQYNENTAKLGQNKRFILGTKAYNITGYTDFVQEFTGNRESVHLLKFTARVEEPTVNDDVDENYIADGKIYTFGAEVTGGSEMWVGQTSKLDAHFIKNGETVEPTEENPLEWKWESSDTSVLNVDESGNVTAVGFGDATVRATLTQNPSVHANFRITVVTAVGDTYIAFTNATPREIKQYAADTVAAAYFAGGNATDNALEWEFQGADASCYNYSVADDGMAVDIYCVHASPVALVVKARYNGKSASVQINLVGY